MKVFTKDAAHEFEIVGTGVELANDGSWARLRLYGEGQGAVVTLEGTPRNLRNIGRNIQEGLRKPKSRPGEKESL